MGRGTIAALTNEPATRLRNVTKIYNGTLAVNDVTFDVAPGELVTLLGPSGCGKTTTMRAIAGLEELSSGEIFLKSQLVSAAVPRFHAAPEKRDVGMVFQSYALWPHMTVFDNVAYPLACRRVDKAEITRRVREGLALVGMDAFEKRKATQLSGGQQQRVGLARAIVMRPSVLLLDEPLSNLDANLRVQMRAHIKSLQRQIGVTMIYVTHDQSEAMALSDRVVVMNAGGVVQIGTPEQIYERPRTRFVADFVGETNFISGRVTAYRRDQKLLTLALGAQSIVAVCGDDAPQAGSDALMMIRPEHIVVSTSDVDGRPSEAARANVLTGLVTNNTYCGDRRDLNIEVEGAMFQVTVPSDTPAPPGSHVSLMFAARHVRFLS